MPNYDNSTHIVYLDLPVDVVEKIDEVRRFANSPGLKRWVAHITLKQDADYIVETDEIRELVRDYAFILKPVKLTLGDLIIHKESDGVSWNIFVDIKERELLHKLTKNLSRILYPLTTENKTVVWEQTDEYYPHVSIISGKGIEEGEKLLEKLRTEYNMVGLTECKSITLARWESDHWLGIEKFDLGLL